MVPSPCLPSEQVERRSTSVRPAAGRLPGTPASRAARAGLWRGVAVARPDRVHGWRDAARTRREMAAVPAAARRPGAAGRTPVGRLAGIQGHVAAVGVVAGSAGGGVRILQGPRKGRHSTPFGRPRARVAAGGGGAVRDIS